MAEITGNFPNIRQEAQEISGVFLSLWGQNYLNGSFPNLRTETQAISGNFMVRWGSFSQTTGAAIGLGTTPIIYPSGASTTQPNFLTAATKVIIRDASLGTVKEVDVYKYVTALEIGRGYNQQSTMSVTFDDTLARTFAPFNSASTFYDWITLKSFSAPWVPRRTIQVQIKIGDDVWHSPVYLPINLSRSEQFAGQTVLSCVDLTRNLCQENQTLESKETTAIGIQWAKDIVNGLLLDYKIPAWNNRMDNFPVRKMHLQGSSPIDLITSLLEIPVAYWFMDGSSFEIVQPSKPFGGDWKYVDKDNIFSMNYSWSLVDLINEIDITRTQEGGGEETFENEGSGACGLQTVTLSKPRYSPTFRISPNCKWGKFSVIDWINADGVYRSQGGVGPWTTCQFVFQQDESYRGSIASGTAYWKIYLGGITQEEVMYGIDYDASYNVKVKDSANQAEYGIWPAPTPINNPLIPNSDWAKIHGRRFLTESIRKTRRLSLTVPINPWIKPCDIISLTDFQSVMVGTKCFVEQVTHNPKDFQTSAEVTIWPD